MPEFQPLHIRAYLQTPIICDRYLPLDGIIFNQFIREKFGAKSHTLPRQSTNKEYSGFNLPLQKRNMNEEEWYYACSFAVFPTIALRDKHEYAKRFDFHEAGTYADFEGRRGRIDTARGEFKNYFVKEYTWSTPYVDWYARGIKDELEKLLAFCTHIGKKSSQGCGSLLCWEVMETDKDWYKNDDKGNLMRAIPSQNGQYYYGIRPAYWHPRHQAKVLLPQ